MRTRDINLNIHNLKVQGDSVMGHIRSLSTREKSGFVLDTLSTWFQLNSRKLICDSLLISTPYSRLTGRLRFSYKHWDDYNYFVHRVRMRVHFNSSSVNMGDIAYFAPDLKGWRDQFALSGDFFGAVNNLRGNHVDIGFQNSSHFKGRFDFSGLPDIDRTFITLEASDLQTNSEDLAQLQIPPFEAHKKLEIPKEIKELGMMHFKGSFTGFINEFVAYGELNSKLGELKSDLQLNRSENNDSLSLDGNLKSVQFDVGKLLDDTLFGPLTAQLKLDAKSNSKDVHGKVSGAVNSFVINKYRYQNISINGDFGQGMFNGKLKSRDPNLTFDFDGLVDYHQKPAVYDFEAQLYNANLQALNISVPGKINSLSANLRLNLTGASINDVSGFAQAQNVDLCSADSAWHYNKISLNAQQLGDSRKVTLLSDFMDATILGKYDLISLRKSFNLLLAGIFPSLQDKDDGEIPPDQIFTLNATTKNTDDLLSWLYPGWHVASGSSVVGSINTQERKFSLLLSSGEIAHNAVKLKNFNLDLEKESDILALQGRFQQIALSDSAQVENVRLNSKAYMDEADVNLNWQNESDRSKGNVSLVAWARDNNHYGFKLLPSHFNILANEWQLKDTALVNVDSSQIVVKNLNFTNDSQQVAVHGVVARDTSSALHVDVHNFDLSQFNSLIGDAGRTIGGTMNVTATLRDLYRKRIVESHAEIDHAKFDNYPVGQVELQTIWNRYASAINTEGSIINSNARSLHISGNYFPKRKDNNLDMVLSLNDFNLDVFNSFDLQIISDLEGKASGKLNIKGDLGAPKLQGVVKFDSTSFLVDYLNTRYTFNDEVRVEPTWFGVDYKPIYDSEGHKGYLVGQAFHDNFSNWNFDAYADVTNFKLFNTTEEMNQDYYGTAYATGSVQIGGYLDKLEINMDVTTGKNTVLNVPLDNSQDVSLEDFIQFVDHSKHDSTQTTGVDLTGITMNMSVHATPDAQVQLIFDKQVGDIIKGRGNGDITFNITPSGDFNMFGRYVITQGDYLFTLRGIVNKHFLIKDGGSIFWYGDPYNAEINLSAEYQTRAPLYEIMVENRDQYRSRVPVNVEMKLTNKLQNPDIAFDINLPTAGQTERAQLESAISTDQERNKQVFGLLVLNRFLPVAGYANQADYNSLARNSAASGSATVSEFLSNRVSSWLSALSQDVDIGINIRPGDNVTSQELAVALSTQLFNERLRLSGNFGVTKTPATLTVGPAQNDLIGDFELQYLMTQDGRFRLRVFNKSNTYDIATSNPTGFTQGVGLVYQQDFSTFNELLQKMVGIVRKGEPPTSNN